VGNHLVGVLLLLLPLLLLLLHRWLSSLMWTFISLMDFSHSALFYWLLYPVVNFAFINICLYTVPPSISWSSF
jgi:hypothetical protein